jgi:hypothetical protein
MDLRLQFVAHLHQVYDCLSPHLVHKVSAVNFDRKLANLKFGSDLFVQSAFGNFEHDLPFAVRQQCKSITYFQKTCFRLAPHPVFVKCNLNCIYQILMMERLRQEIDRSSLNGSHRHSDVAMR